MLDTFFFFNDTATTEIYTLSLHDALPIYHRVSGQLAGHQQAAGGLRVGQQQQLLLVHAVRIQMGADPVQVRSEEHTSELQSRQYLVCRLLLEKKKNIDKA